MSDALKRFNEAKCRFEAKSTEIEEHQEQARLLMQELDALNAMPMSEWNKVRQARYTEILEAVSQECSAAQEDAKKCKEIYKEMEEAYADLEPE